MNVKLFLVGALTLTLVVGGLFLWVSIFYYEYSIVFKAIIFALLAACSFLLYKFYNHRIGTRLRTVLYYATLFGAYMAIFSFVVYMRDVGLIPSPLGMVIIVAMIYPLYKILRGAFRAIKEFKEEIRRYSSK